VLVIVWIIFNLVAIRERFDPYPFILLNLVFSTQAAYAAPLILLAQNRQAERDRREFELDRPVTGEMRAATDFPARELAAARRALGRIEATLARSDQRPEEAGASSCPGQRGAGVSTCAGSASSRRAKVSISWVWARLRRRPPSITTRPWSPNSAAW